MKCFNTSFLFFYILLVLFIVISPVSCYSQNPADSSGYYYKAILHPSAPIDLPDGIAYYSRKKDLDLTNGDTLEVIRDLRMIAIGQYKIGNIYNSENSIVEALGIIDQLKNKDTLAGSRIGLYNQLGRIYRTLNNHEEAIKALDNALKIARKTKDSITILNNKANIYKDLNEFERALDQYEQVYAKCLHENDSLQFAMVLDNLGYVQSKLNSPKALDNLNQALDIRIKEYDLTGMYASYKSLTHYFMDRQDRDRALFYADKAYEATKKINSKAYNYDVLSLFMTLDNNPKVMEYNRLTDSISEAKQLAENKNAFIKYNLNEERKKTTEQELQREKEKRSKLLFQAITGLVSLLLIASYFIFRYRYKKGKQEQVYKTETRISKKIHDELSNDVYKLMAQLQHDPADPSAVDQLQHIYRQTRNISRENNPIDTGDGFQEELSAMLSGYIPANAKLILKGLESINWKRISGEKKVVLYRVLQEFMTNMNKHSKARLVAITFNMLPRSLKVDYVDNGIGMAGRPSYLRGGLQNVENRISSVRGSLTFDTSEGKGFRAGLRIPN